LDAELMQLVLIRAPVILFSLTVHEFFHAWTAYRRGDPTARDMGRLTFNPIRHLDLFGLIVMVITEFRFGWAKPVPVDPRNLRNPRTDDIWISAAGPLSNIGLAVLAGMLFRAMVSLSPQLPPAVAMLLQYAVHINLVLAFFNLIPLFPLDGSHILRNLLPPRYEDSLQQMDRFSPFILLLLLITGVLGLIIWPPVITIARWLLGG
jgi:Zn-dependent protease